MLRVADEEKKVVVVVVVVVVVSLSLSLSVLLSLSFFFSLNSHSFIIVSLLPMSYDARKMDIIIKYRSFKCDHQNARSTRTPWLARQTRDANGRAETALGRPRPPGARRTRGALARRIPVLHLHPLGPTGCLRKIQVDIFNSPFDAFEEEMARDGWTPEMFRKDNIGNLLAMPKSCLPCAGSSTGRNKRKKTSISASFSVAALAPSSLWGFSSEPPLKANAVVFNFPFIDDDEYFECARSATGGASLDDFEKVRVINILNESEKEDLETRLLEARSAAEDAVRRQRERVRRVQEKTTMTTTNK